jgi:hypothetical protein
MHQACYYSPAERQQEKERHRASDADDLRSGRISRDELRARNGFFSSLDIVESSIICEEAFA